MQPQYISKDMLQQFYLVYLKIGIWNHFKTSFATAKQTNKTP